MSSIPLRYDSLKCVLQHMEANKRIRVSRCCPSIRAAERATPLKINHLDFKRGKIRINDITYSIGTYKKFHVGEIPKALKMQNDQGGLNYALDKFGIVDKSDDVFVTPGDIKIRREFSNHMQGAQIFSHLMNTEEIEEFLRTSDQIIVQSGERDPDEYREEMLLPYRAVLIPMQYKRDNMPPPFENQIQLNITSEGSTYIERCMRPKEFHQAVKQLGALIFGERKQLIFVKNFRLSDYNFVIRLPIGVKFHIRNIRFCGSVDMNCNLLSPINHESSYPLEQLYVEHFQTEEVAHSIVQGAKMITLYLFPGRQYEPLFALTNRSVHIKVLRWDGFSVETLKFYIRNWIERKLPTGTHFKLQVHDEEPIGDWFEGLQREFDGIAGERSVIIPMSVDSELIVSHKDSFLDEFNQPKTTVEVLVNQL